VPIVDGRLPDGSRVHVVLPPVSLEGPVITIRKFQKGGMTMERLTACGEFPPELAAVLACLVRGRYSILISGATNSGKSSLLNALAGYLLPDERIITIEDSAELQFYHVDNLVRLETRNANAEGANAITMNDLIKASLRMRPTRIIVGEVRGEEAGALLNAASTGHSGSLSTIHSNSCRDALRRLETMVLMGMDIPLRAVQGLIASAMDILIHLGRLSTGQRKILEIYELLDFDGQEYQMNPLFLYERGEDEEKKGGLRPGAGWPGPNDCGIMGRCMPMHRPWRCLMRNKTGRDRWKDWAVTILAGEGIIALLALVGYDNLLWMLPLQILLLPVHKVLKAGERSAGSNSIFRGSGKYCSR